MGAYLRLAGLINHLPLTARRRYFAALRIGNKKSKIRLKMSGKLWHSCLGKRMSLIIFTVTLKQQLRQLAEILRRWLVISGAVHIRAVKEKLQ